MRRQHDVTALILTYKVAQSQHPVVKQCALGVVKQQARRLEILEDSINTITTLGLMSFLAQKAMLSR